MANDQKCGACCKEESPVPTPTSAHSGAQLVFSISNMDCPTEEKLIRKHLEGKSGIDALQFNLMERKLTVTTALSVSAVQSALQEIGMQAVPATIEGGLVTGGEPPEERSRATWWITDCH